MGAFLYGTALQWRLDIRSRTLLITCYVVPLLFFAMMGGIFTSVNPSARETLVPSMTVMGVSMGALIGLPPSLVEIFSSLHSSVGHYVPVGAAARHSWCGGTDISCVMGLLPDEGRRIFRWEPVAAGSGDGNVVRSLHAAAQALGERVRRNRPDKMFWDKAVLFIEAPTA